MRKKYPYLEEPYVYNLNDEQQKKSILGLIDDFVNQRQYVNITLLDWEENPLKEIQGIIASGSISKDGNSSVRRSCSLSCSISKEEYNIDLMEMDFSLNKKIFIEIGIKNETEYYLDYPIFWFPQGVFYIDSFSINSSTSSAVNLNINLKDKMCLLNGTVGGTLPSTVQFDIMTTQLADGTITEQKVLYYNIIRELVHHWGEESLNNIIIQDVPLRIRRVMQWNNSQQDIYLVKEYMSDDSGGNIETQLYINESDFNKDGVVAYNKYSLGDRVGYIYDDFVPTSEITGAAGDTVCTILDTIKNQLGNFEYFYDVFGIFHFREIKNYLNINQSTIILQESGNPGRHINLQEGQFLLDSGSERQYLIETTNNKNSYTFDANRNVTSISVTPNYNNIKNDFIINGIRKNDQNNSQFLIRYRLVIDDKPEIVDWIRIDEDNYKGNYGSFNNVLYYTYPEYSNGTIINEVNKLGFWYDNWTTISEEEAQGDETARRVDDGQDEEGNDIYHYEKLMYPTVGNMDQIYRVIENGESVFYLWTGAGYHKLYLKDSSIDPSENTNMLFVENTVDENIENSETVENAILIQSLESMVSFIQGQPWWTYQEDWPFFAVNINNNKYFSYETAIRADKIQTLNSMAEFFKQYVNILPYSSIINFIEYEKLPNKKEIEPPLYSTIEAIESLLLDKIETLKTKEEIAKSLKQYLNKEYIDIDSDLIELQTRLPQDITDENFFKRYPNSLNLSSLLDWCNGNRTIYETQEEVDSYIQSVIDDLVEITNSEDIYQLIFNSITNWRDEKNDINQNIEKLLNFLVGTKDVLSPLKYSNYEDLNRIYITNENNDNVYDNLKNVLNTFNTNKETKNFNIYESSSYLFTNEWKEKRQNEFLGNSNIGLIAVINNFYSKKESWKKEVQKHWDKWPKDFCDQIINIFGNENSNGNEYGFFINLVYNWIYSYLIDINTNKEWYNWKTDINNLILTTVKDIMSEEDANNLIMNWEVAKTTNEKKNCYNQVFNQLILKVRNSENIFNILDNIFYDIAINKKALEDFKNYSPTLQVVLEKALRTYNLRNKLALVNQNDNDEIKLKPIIYSSNIPYLERGNWLGEYYTLDWRTYLYLYGLYANKMGTDPGPYFSDLETFWPYEYNLNRDKQCFLNEIDSSLEVQYKELTNGNFFFDIIDANSSSLGEFSVKNIGRRIDVVNDENINCLFEPEIPDIVFLNKDNPDMNWSENTTVTELRNVQDVQDKLYEQRQECINNNQPYIQVSDEIFNSLTTGKYLSDAYEQIKYELFAHLKYQKVVSITALPAYYLEPNSRVTLNDYTTNTYGDYMIQNINLTLGPGANMAVTLNEVSERL